MDALLKVDGSNRLGALPGGLRAAAGTSWGAWPARLALIWRAWPVVAWFAGLAGPPGSAWLRRLPAMTRRCSSIQDTSRLGREARKVAMDARNSSGV